MNQSQTGRTELLHATRPRSATSADTDRELRLFGPTRQRARRQTIEPSRAHLDAHSLELCIGLISFCEDTRRSRRLRPFPLRGPKRTGPARRHAAWVNEAWGCSKPGGCSATVLAKTPSVTELDGRFSCDARHGSTTRGDDQTNPQSLEGAAQGPHHNSPGHAKTRQTRRVPLVHWALSLLFVGLLMACNDGDSNAEADGAVRTTASASPSQTDGSAMAGGSASTDTGGADVGGTSSGGSTPADTGSVGNPPAAGSSGAQTGGAGGSGGDPTTSGGAGGAGGASGGSGGMGAGAGGNSGAMAAGGAGGLGSGTDDSESGGAGGSETNPAEMEAGVMPDDMTGAGGVGGDAGEADDPDEPQGADYEACPPTGPCKIMPFGDSITEGCCNFMGGYRVGLFQLAREAGHEITFVGSASNGPAMVDGVPFPQDHEGHGGYTIEDEPARNTNGIAPFVGPSMASYMPDIITLMIGTNDLNGNIDVQDAPRRLGALLDSIFEADPDVLVILAQIVPTTNDGTNQVVSNYNAAMPALVAERTAMGRHLILIDMYGAFERDANYKTSLMADGLHPNDAGYARMAETWYEAIEPYLR